MTEIEICEQTIAALHAKRNAASKRVNELAGERQKLAFAVHAAGDKAARGRLDVLNAENATLTADLENIHAALQEGEARLAAVDDEIVIWLEQRERRRKERRRRPAR